MERFELAHVSQAADQVASGPGFRRDDGRDPPTLHLAAIAPAGFRRAEGSWHAPRSLQQKWEPVLRPEGAPRAGNSAGPDKR